jgi:predicted nuclease of predicted toxin-antitoxin system
MHRFVTDEHVPAALVRALRAREPGLDIVRNVKVGLRTADDRALLDWAAGEGRVILSNDSATMIGYAYDRIASGLPFGGLVIYHGDVLSGRLIGDILTVAVAATADELAVQIIHLPI